MTEILAFPAASRAPADESPRAQTALGNALKQIPVNPAGFSASVAHLQMEPARLSAQSPGIRALQRFRDSLFHAPGREAEMRQLWRESLAAGCLARMIGSELGCDTALLTGAALMHRLGDVLALRALATAEFVSGQRLGNTVLREFAAAQRESLAGRAMKQWSLSDELGVLLSNAGSDEIWTDTDPAGRHLLLAELLAFELVHAGRSTPGVVEAAFDRAQLSMALLETLRSAQPSIDALLLRAAPRMGTISLVQ